VLLSKGASQRCALGSLRRPRGLSESGPLATACAIAGILATASASHAFLASVAGRSVEIDGVAEVREVFETDRSTGRDRTLEMLRLRAGLDVSDWLRLDATALGSNGGPTFKATRSGTFNLDDVFQDVSPSIELEELYADARFDDLDLRIGKQKLAWGKLDRFQPNDLINPERFVDPMLQEEDERKIGVPSVQTSYYFPSVSWLPRESRLTGVWVPVYVPFRFPEAGERWFPPAATAVESFHVPEGTASLPDGQPVPAFDVPLRFRAQNLDRPARTLVNGTWATRLSGLIGEADVALYYHHGFDVAPAFRLTATAFAPPDLGQLPDGITAETSLTPVFRRIDAWGADLAYPLGSVTLRTEGAYVSGRAFNRDLRFLVNDPAALAPQVQAAVDAFLRGATAVPVDLGDSFVTRDAVEWGVGADYSNSGYLLLLQLNQTDVLRNDVDLLIKDVETRLLANVRKRFLADRLETQIVTVYAIESDYTIAMPRLTYQLTDALDLRLGYLFIAGRQSSIGGQFKRNDQGFVRLRYSF
jgi:hypothetical protein